MKKYIIVLGFIMVLFLVTIFYNVNSPKSVTLNLISSIENNNEINYIISKEDKEKILYFFDYAYKNNLNKPELDVVTSDYSDKITVLFTIKKYDEYTLTQNDIYGEVSLKLEKISFFNWKIDVISMKEYSS